LAVVNSVLASHKVKAPVVATPTIALAAAPIAPRIQPV